MAQSYAELLMGSGMPAGLAHVVAAPYEVAPTNALPGTNIDRLPTVPIWGTVSPEANIAMNIYLDSQSRWCYLADGPGALLRLVKQPPHFEIQLVPPGVKGALVSGWTVVFTADCPAAQGEGAAVAAAAAATVHEELALDDAPEPHGGTRRRR